MIIVRSPRTTSGLIASRIRFRSSGAAFADHKGFGTTPNIEPPSSRKNPSCSEISSRSPKRVPGDAGRIGEHRRRLLELDEHAVRAGRVNERDERAFGSRPRLFVDEPRAAALELRQRRRDVVHAQRDVVQPGAALLDVLRDRRVRRRRLQKLEARVAHGHEAGAHSLRDDVLGRLDLEAERIAIERQRGVQVAHGDADMVQNGFHDTSAFTTKAKGTKAP